MDNYPMMSASELERAPWTQKDNPEKSFEITCSQSLSKTVKVVTNNYNHVVEREAYNRIYEEYDDTSDTDWAEEYHSNDYHTPLQLIQLLEKVLERDLEQGIVFKSPKFTEAIINECKDWSEDETAYLEN